MEPKIVGVRISPLPKKFGDPMPEVWVMYENSSTEEFLYDYYPDEISFTHNEFIGLTKSEAITLKYNKDRHYLTT